jgi:hypothetical protein
MPAVVTPAHFLAALAAGDAATPAPSRPTTSMDAHRVRARIAARRASLSRSASTARFSAVIKKSA